MLTELAGRTAVITGGASGIGRALARRGAAEGMRLVLADIEQAPLDAVVGELREQGAEVLGVRTDVSKADQVEALAQAATEAFGPVHLLCNNAGVVTGGPAWQMSLEDWEWVVGVDLWSVVHGVRAFVPAMVAGAEPAHVVNTASVAGLTAFPGIAPYNVAKVGVVALSETLHHDLHAAGHRHVGVSVLCPGVVPTRISESARNRPGEAGGPAPAMDIATQRTPPPTARTPEQIADEVVSAVRTGRFWILTHPHYGPVVEERARGIVAGADPLVPPVA